MKIIHKKLFIFKNTTYIINRRIFRALLVQGTFFTYPFANSSIGRVAKAITIKVCMFRGLLHDLIKV